MASRLTAGPGLADSLDGAATLVGAWRQGSPPPELQTLLAWVTEGNLLNLYLTPS